VSAQQPLEDLISLLDLEAIEVNIFRGQSPNNPNQVRVFGGQVAGQALVAAGRTVERGLVHSLHAYFLRPGDPMRPILYQVDRIRDGKSFTTRRVVAIQNGQAIFNLQASFHVPEPGLEHQLPMDPEVPQADTLPTWQERLAPFADRMGDWYHRPRPIDIRYIDTLPFDRAPASTPFQKLWFRADGTLPDDPLLHACIVTYASDMTLLDTTVLPHGISWDDAGVQMASLDHAMWFHRPFRADSWLLYDQGTPSTSGSRGLAYGFIYAETGELCISVVQEGLIRAPSSKR
jgi:acyl-CoA thioesterase II